MYTPKHFEMPVEQYANFIEQFPLATIISRHQLEISQCPLVYLEDKHQLIGHLSIGNPQLAAFEQDNQVKAVFSGYDGYISAAWYPTSDQVPTWNYSSLEISGRVYLANQNETEEILIKQTTVLEQRVNENWTLDKLPDIKRQAMLKAIRAFVIDIESWQGKNKLSQNKSDDVRAILKQKCKAQTESSYYGLVTRM